MKLYFEQNGVSVTFNSVLRDVTGSIKYYIEGEIYSADRKQRLYDVNGFELACISCVPFKIMPYSKITSAGELVSNVKKVPAFLLHKYILPEKRLFMIGDVFFRKFELVEKGKVVMTVSKVFVEWGYSYELDIADDFDETLAICSALCIEKLFAIRR